MIFLVGFLVMWAITTTGVAINFGRTADPNEDDWFLGVTALGFGLIWPVLLVGWFFGLVAANARPKR